MYKRIKQAAKTAIVAGTATALTIAVSVLGTTIGTNISADGNLTVSGNSTFGNAATDVNIFTGTLNASTTALFDGAASFNGNVTIGNAVTDTFTLNAATTTIASASLTALSIATSSANIPFLRFDTSNYRIGISTTSPTVTFSVGGAGHIYALGGLGVGVATTTAGQIQASGDGLFEGDLWVSDDSKVTGGLGVGTTATTTNGMLEVSGDGLFGGDIWVSDDSKITGGLGVGTTATTTNGMLEVSSDGLFGGDIWVSDDSKITGGLGVGTTATTTNGSLQVSGASQFGDVISVDQAGTSTISVHSTTAVRGGCIELEGADGASTFRLYATSTNTVAVFESGTCK